MLRNIGTAPLIIDKVMTSCGCMDTVLSENIILPGQTIDLQVDLKAAKYRKPINETVLLSTNDNSKPQVALKLKANVVTKLRIRPSALNFGILAKKDFPCSRSIRVSLNKDMINYRSYKDCKWEVSSTEPMFLKPKIQPDANDINSLIVTATLSEFVIPGPISGLITVIAIGNNGEEIFREIACLGKVLGPIAVLPDSIIWNWNHKIMNKSITLDIIRGEELPLRLEISSRLSAYVNAIIEGQNKICLTLLPEATIVNQQSIASKIVGSIWLVERSTSKRMLSIPVVILGK